MHKNTSSGDIAYRHAQVGRPAHEKRLLLRRRRGALGDAQHHHKAYDEQRHNREHAQRAVAGGCGHGAYDEGAENGRVLAKDIEEPKVLVGVVLGAELAKLGSRERLQTAWKSPTMMARIQNSTAVRRKNAANSVMKV